MHPILCGLSDEIGLGTAGSSVADNGFAASSDQVIQLRELDDQLIVCATPLLSVSEYHKLDEILLRTLQPVERQLLEIHRDELLLQREACQFLRT